MATLIVRRDRPNFIVQTAENRQRSLGIRRDEPGGLRRAKAAVAKITAEELASPQAARSAASARRDLWAAWVPAHIGEHYTNPRTLHRSGYFWDALCTFLEDRRIHRPSQLTYTHAEEYLTWRTSEDSPRRASKNTALEEIKFLATLTAEAVRRGYTNENPWAQFRRRPDPRRQKAELTDPHIRAVRAALADAPPHYSRLFEACLHQGCRISEASIHLTEQVDHRRARLSFPRTKTTPFVTLLHPSLRAPLARLAAAGEERTAPPVEPAHIAHLNRLIKKATRNPAHSSHSCRVTFITRLHRLEWPEAKVRRAVNHAGSLIHQVYLRLGPDDLYHDPSRPAPDLPHIAGWPDYTHLDPPAWMAPDPG